ncbi:MAG: hypothetical protein ACJ72H_28645 [Candidatus Sulfotelmatobacter sp.]
MSATPFYQLGRELQRISESLTFAHYKQLHPHVRIGFTHREGRVYFTLTDGALGHRGVIKYADNAQEIIECAFDALFREGEIETH